MTHSQRNADENQTVTGEKRPPVGEREGPGARLGAENFIKANKGFFSLT